METYVFEPPEPITTYWYQCNNEFFLEPLEYMIEEKGKLMVWQLSTEKRSYNSYFKR